MSSNEIMHQGINKINSGDMEGGMQLINHAIALDPNDPEKLHARGQIFAALKKPSEAILDYKKAISMNPNVYQYHYNLGNVYMDFRQFQDAYNCFSNAALINPEDTDIYSNRGMCLIQLSRRKEAYNDFKKALNSNPSDHIAKTGMNILLSVDPSLKD
jgi:tetratricopeptide (TPR) repeat protein